MSKIRRVGSAVALLFVFLCLANAPVLAQAPSVPVGQLIGTGTTLVAGDVTFSNFTQVPATVGIAPPLDGFGNIAASATVNPDGSVSLVFTAINPATGVATPITAGYMQSIAYDLTVTNPAFLLGSVNQHFGPGTTRGFNILTYRAPAPSVVEIPQFFPGTDGTLIFDHATGAVVTLPDGTPTLQIQRSGALYPLGCQNTDGVFFVAHSAPYGCGSSLPGGNRASLGLENFFGVLTDNHSFLGGFSLTAPFSFDAIAMTFTLVPADTPVTPIPVNLQAFDVSQPGVGSVSLAHTIGADGFSHPGFAPAGGVPVTLTSSNTAALPLPPTMTMPQGATATSFPIGDAQVDAPTPVNATATYNGVTLQQNVTVSPAVPLNLATFNVRVLANTLNVGATLNNIQFSVNLNRKNFSPAVVALSSSSPAIAVPTGLNIPALTVPGIPGTGTGFVVTVPFQPVAVDTPVTFSATFNGVTLNSTVTIPKMVDGVKVAKAELIVKSGSLKVEATSTVPSAVLTLYNASTGALIGTMNNNGPSGTGAKYSYQGVVSPVTSLLLKSSFSGTATGAVAQK
ncbi:MAG: hypothetical protein QOH71_2483 [Blastocatellia bacterium]|jgi:hypothetical protein|nr:hypothetical protein [Blastocatellia bacterium]